ncbi:MAG: alpha/beta fold hydrolase [Bacteroidota bacterium]
MLKFVQQKLRQKTQTRAKKAKRPSLFWFLTEAGRATAELGISYPYRKLFTDHTQGDGHPVLVIPGFMSTDVSTVHLRRYISNMGYRALPWELGRNYGKTEFIEQLSIQIEQIHAQYSEKVSLIGWSLGGIFARQLGKRHPDKVRQIITLGSPFKGVGEGNNVAWIYNLLKGTNQVAPASEDLLEEIPASAPVPTTAIYTKQDGIVPWRLCMEEESYLHQNIEVRGSHFGLGHNLSVMRIVADRLQYREENWVAFRTDNVLEDWFLYPSVG